MTMTTLQPMRLAMQMVPWMELSLVPMGIAIAGVGVAAAVLTKGMRNAISASMSSMYPSVNKRLAPVNSVRENKNPRPAMEKKYHSNLRMQAVVAVACLQHSMS
jgi:hypothetical protein